MITFAPRSLAAQELVGVHDLLSKGLAPVTRVNSLEREAARLEGERGALVASIAKTNGQIAEVELQILQIDIDFQSEVARDIREIHAETGEFTERQIAALDQLLALTSQRRKAVSFMIWRFTPPARSLAKVSK